MLAKPDAGQEAIGLMIWKNWLIKRLQWALREGQKTGTTGESWHVCIPPTVHKNKIYELEKEEKEKERNGKLYPPKKQHAYCTTAHIQSHGETAGSFSRHVYLAHKIHFHRISSHAMHGGAGWRGPRWATHPEHARKCGLARRDETFTVADDRSTWSIRRPGDRTTDVFCPDFSPFGRPPLPATTAST